MIMTDNGVNFKEDMLIIEKIINDGKIKELREIGSGAYSTVYKFKKFAIKVFYGYQEQYANEYSDYKFLKIFNDNEHFPNLYAYEEGKFVIVDYIRGYLLNDIEDVTNNFKVNLFKGIEDYKALELSIRQQVDDIFDICFNKNIIPYDLHENNIIIDRNGFVHIVDVGYFTEYSYNIKDSNYLNNLQLQREIGFAYDTFADSMFVTYEHQEEEDDYYEDMLYYVS